MTTETDENQTSPAMRIFQRHIYAGDIRQAVKGTEFENSPFILCYEDTPIAQVARYAKYSNSENIIVAMLSKDKKNLTCHTITVR